MVFFIWLHITTFPVKTVGVLEIQVDFMKFDISPFLG